MIQAFVFLPLRGAIRAGLIALFGAHARHPSGDTVEHHHDDGHHHAADAHAHAHAHAHHEHGHDDHG
ncbi:hypothetical protein, partial [Bradyrhizobium sp.]|uniref:hypothetical protein n=1 Tax=Bradyrhizobium sp. TaxID=376 RepID=UPI00391B99A0